MYQKLAGSEDEPILQEFQDDLREEYGAPPRQVENLLAVLRLKLACRRSGVTRVKMDETAGRKEVVLTLSTRVTAKEIMQILQVNSQWKISGSNLRISFDELERVGGKKEIQWMAELTKEIATLQRKKEVKKAEKEEE